MPVNSNAVEFRPELSVVILCYRAEDFVPTFVSQMKKVLDERRLSYELVLVANYHADAVPADRTPEIVWELARRDPTLTVVAKAKEGMMGWDMRSGLAVARGETVAVIDGDGQMPPPDVLAVYDCLRDGGYDIAKTYRQERHDGAYRLVISRVYNASLRVLFPSVRVRDANGKPKIFTRPALERLTLTSSGWFIDAEIIIQASQLGLHIGEVPTVFYMNPQRPSFIRVWAILEFIGNLMRYRITGRCR
jgi:glycosyltransferase involved in cell wall biosynthesis